MRRVICTIVTIVFLTCLPIAAEAQQALTAQLVSDIKAATVFVKVKAGDMAGSGSGFVIHVEGDTAYIVTNRHVVEPKLAEVVVVRDPRYSGRGVGGRRGRGMPGFAPPFMPPMMPGMPGMPGFGQQQQEEERPRYLARVVVHEYKNTEVTAVFHSGMKDEESAAGSLVAVDPDEDLAVVKVKGVKQGLKPIQYANSPQPSETMPIYVFGFPLGEDLATGKRNPAITVGKGSVSSLRNDDGGNLSVVQLDAALNHGNSGGPVVDAQGQLVGVAVARITEDNSQNISFAVPARAVSRLLQGRLAKTELQAAKNGEDGMTIHVTVPLVDPLQKIKSAEFRYLSATAVSNKPKPSDSLDGLPGCHTLHLKIENGVASGDINVKKKVTAVAFLHQSVSKDEDGKQAISDNRQDSVALVVPAKPAAPSAASLAGESRPAPTAGSIGIHLNGGGRSVDGEAGVAPMSNWNNLAGFTFDDCPLINNSGANSGATFSLKDTTGVWNTGNTNQLLNGYVSSGGFKPLTLTISHIPYAQYTMYIYVGDSTLGTNAKVTVNNKTYYYAPEGSAPTGYAAITNTNSATHQMGNFVEVRGLTGATQTVTMAGSTQQYSGLCAVEIVNLGPPVRNAGAPPRGPIRAWLPRPVNCEAGRGCGSIIRPCNLRPSRKGSLAAPARSSATRPRKRECSSASKWDSASGQT